MLPRAGSVDLNQKPTRWIWAHAAFAALPEDMAVRTELHAIDTLTLSDAEFLTGDANSLELVPPFGVPSWVSCNLPIRRPLMRTPMCRAVEAISGRISAAAQLELIHRGQARRR